MCRLRDCARLAFWQSSACATATTLDLYGHLYPGDMDRYADRLDQAAASPDASLPARIRPDESDDDADEDTADS
jgi:hypothetical protein